MTKPLNENLIAVRVETEAGDLVPIKDATGFPVVAGKPKPIRTPPGAPGRAASKSHDPRPL